jgi:hypothetical protein
MTTFPGFFPPGSGHEPHPYHQHRLAEADPLPDLVNIPAGAGKTAAVVPGRSRRLRLGQDGRKDYL